MPDEQTTTTTESEAAREASDEQTPENLLKALKAEREARRALEREIKPLRTYKQQQDDAAKTSEERLAAREKAVADQEARITMRLRTSILRDEIGNAVAAERLTLQAPVGDVLRLMDSDAVEWDGETPKNVRQLLRDLVKDRPYLATKRPGTADGGAGDSGDRALDMNTVLRQAAGRTR